ncbi:unnamed protein product [Urochloa decumbens]|uniref:F-box domain-containing protein n=1 Tax=Urochloa decumbens TaxID=240449 RepID=A0ABC9G1H7_9POAL
MDQGTTAAPYLPDELVVEILARLPAKLLCRFKCVSRRWRRLISDPAHRARLAQTLSGFFFVSRDPGWRFIGLPSSVTPLGGDGGRHTLILAPYLQGEGDQDDGLMQRAPPLALLRRASVPSLVPILHRLQSSHQGVGGLATTEAQPRETLFIRYTSLVCCYRLRSGRLLAFLCVSGGGSLQVVEADYMIFTTVKEAEVYSSETGTWGLSECKPDWLSFCGRMTFFNGCLHLPIDSDAVLSLDAKDKSWRVTQSAPLCGLLPGPWLCRSFSRALALCEE